MAKIKGNRKAETVLILLAGSHAAALLAVLLTKAFFVIT